MTYKCLLYDVKDHVATLTLNRPERLNALGDTLREDFYDAVKKAAAEPEVRVLVVTGAGKGLLLGRRREVDEGAGDERRDGLADRPGVPDARPRDTRDARLPETDHRGGQRRRRRVRA